jgi:putative transposase
MPRAPRADEAGAIYHALNRGNARRDIFKKDADYEAFERVMVDGLEKYPVDLISYQWMPNHWHMVLSPREDGAMSGLLYWVTMTHTARYHAHYHTTGEGHLYQGRFKSFPVQDDDHFHVVCRYVERNAFAAGFVSRAEDWRWGSLWNWCGGSSAIKLAAWPTPRLARWVQRVNQELDQKEQENLRRCIRRGSPFGEETWVESTARRLNLESTLRARGRPAKFPHTPK